jgi:sulfide:quinone oxidoreductase
MAAIAAQSIAADVRGGERRSRDLFVECILDMGDRAARIKADPVRPPRNIAEVSEGKRWLWAKKSFEKYYLWKARRGKTLTSGWGW